MPDKDNPYGKQIHWLPQEEYDKAIGQLRLGLNGIMACFHGYGIDIFIHPAINEIIKLSEDFGLRVRGVDHPIYTANKPSSNGLRDEN